MRGWIELYVKDERKIINKNGRMNGRKQTELAVMEWTCESCIVASLLK